MKLAAASVVLLGLISVIGGALGVCADLATSPSAPTTVAQQPGAPAPAPGRPGASRPGDVTHRTRELECRDCHQAKHQGVLRMYLGLGGRGTPMIPSHMFQVRVECVACHILPKEAEGRAGLVGQTFRPSEQACVGCHGEKYRGMLDRWTATLDKLREIVAPKIQAARAGLASADPKSPKRAQAQRLVDDADFNVQFVTLGKGVHNVFYAADLLKLSNGWADEALALLGKPPVKADDALVRGGYCAVLCHEQAGVKQLETVTFAKRKIPHVKHITEFGAVCTACHSAEVHKAVTATAATCTSCHHSPQNERCESCHRAQSAFYRGEVKSAPVAIGPDVMANAVACTGCHDWSGKHSRQAVAGKCAGCHQPEYKAFLDQWTVDLDKETAQTADAVRRAEAALAGARRAGRNVSEVEAQVKEARDAVALVRTARGVHNPAAAGALLEAARKKAEGALAQVGRK